MNIYSVSSLIAASFCLSLGIFVFIRRRWDRKCKVFAMASSLIGLWSLFPFALSIARSTEEALFFGRLTYLPAIFTAPVWVHFMLSAVKEKRLKIDSVILTIAYFLSVPFLFISFSPLFIKGVNRFAPHFSVIPGSLFKYFILAFSLIFILYFWAILYPLRTAKGYYRNQLRFILISSIFGVLSGFLHFGAAYFGREPIPHDFLLIIYTSLFAYAIIKYRLMDLTVAITRTGIFMAVYTLIIGVPFAVAVKYHDYLVQTYGSNWWILLAAVMAISATVGPFIYIYLDRKAERRLLHEQRRYQETLRQAAREMARIHNLKKLLNLIVHTVTSTVRISHSAIYLLDKKSNQYILQASHNLKKQQQSIISKESHLVTWLRENKEPVVYDEVNRKSQERRKSVFKELGLQMQSLNAALIVPGFLEDRIIGLLTLGEKRSGKMYSTEDLNTFTLLANQAALAIENALLYENIEDQVKQRTEELVEVQKQLIQAEKLATVGTLAGGVAHEINNPLTAILTNTQMLLLNADNIDSESKESLTLIEEATKRCRSIVKKMMAYAKKPLETAQTADVDISEAIDKVLSFLEYQLEQNNIKVVKESRKGHYLIMGNANELEQVLTNMVLNAKDAIKQIKKSGIIYILLLEDRDWIKIQIKDEGMGIGKEILNKIFDPFFTTKEVGKGLGLGLSICQSIIEKHNGLIKVQSEVNKGSVFTIRLPKIKKESMIKAKL
ncbi:MAG: ATP-binding protein [Candidatus Omnitrophota bacterium]